nr:LacI family DNA-binding transcriptional regulator [Maliibacterium massiliense]
MKPKVTIKMIAERAGTSIGTVDRALNNRPGIGKATKARVLTLAQEMGYTPNQFASALSRKKAIRIAAVYPSHSVFFYNYIANGINRARQEFTDYGVEIDDICAGSLDLQDQEELIRSTDWQKYDGIAINPGANAIGAYIDRFMDWNVPVITFNTDVVDSKRLFYVGHDTAQSGRLGGELMGKMLGGKGGVAILGTNCASLSHLESSAGFTQVIRTDYPDIAIYTCAEYRGNVLAACENTLALLKEHPDIRAVFSTGTGGTMGASMAVKRLNRRDIAVIGYDLTEFTIDALKEGWCTAVLYQDPFQQGYQALRLLARHLLEGWLPPQDHLLIRAKIVLKNNLDNYINSQASDIPFFIP